MAQKGQTPEVDLLPDSTIADPAGKGPWLQNVLHRSGDIDVRMGFGQVAQFDTTLSVSTPFTGAMLGAQLITTDFGHEQCVIVQRAVVFTGGTRTGVESYQVGAFVPVYLVHIYDLTTDTIWEEYLYPQTSSQNIDNDERSALFETVYDDQHEAYLRADDDDAFWFEEVSDVLYMGSAQAGVWAYVPAIFPVRHEHAQLDSAYRKDWHHEGKAESAVVVQVSPADGLFVDAFEYLTASEFPKPTAAARMDNRLVYASGRLLYFTDPDRMSSIVADNFLEVPCGSDITALQEFDGAVFVFTASETWKYQPPRRGLVVSGGPLTQLSAHVGCSGPQAVTRGPGAVYIIDQNGCYGTSGGEPAPLQAEVLDTFWTDHITNPWTSYYQQTGYTDLTGVQPRTSYRFTPRMAHATWDHRRHQLYLTFPEQALTLVNKGETWAVWTYESQANEANAVAMAQIQLPYLLMGRKHLYCLGSPETAAITDAGGGGAQSNTSWYLMRYGRGGGLDRSITYVQEDQRAFMGAWHMINDAGAASQDGNTAVYIGQPIPIPVGFNYPGTDTGIADSYYLPVELVIGTGATASPDVIKIRFEFDVSEWTPIFKDGVSAEVDYLIPPERLASEGGYSPGSPIASSEVRCHTTGGTASRTGTEIRIMWDGNDAQHTGPHAPAMNLNLHHRNRLIWIPFEFTGTAGSDHLTMGLNALQAYVELTSTYTLNGLVYAWQEATHMNERHLADDTAQAVDYALASRQFGLTDGVLVRARTAYLKLRSKGSATTQVEGSAVHGLLNVLFGSDFKGWSEQIVDHDGNLSRVADKSSIRSRVFNASSVMIEKVFEAATLLWGTDDTAGTGNCLVSDPAVDTIAVSSSVKGEHVRLMVFGHIRNRAEKLSFVGRSKLKLLVKNARRRTGR